MCFRMALCVLMVQLMLFIWASDTKKIRINSYRSYGWTWKKIVEFMELVLLMFEGGLWLED